MEKGFCVTCMNCNEKVLLNKLYSKEKDESKITFTALNSGDHQSLYLVCTKCKHTLEVEI